MAKRKSNHVRKQSSRKDDDTKDPYGLNEVDDFANKREKVMLEDSGFDQRSEDEDNISVDEEEEVLGMSEDDDDEEEEEDVDGAAAYKEVFGRRLDVGEAEDEENGMLENDNAWGSSKAEYYGADDLDDDQTAKEVEKEALRQQKKHLEDLQMEDYLGDELEEEWVKEAKGFDLGQFNDTKTQQGSTSVTTRDVLNMDQEAKEQFLKTSFPEYIPLSKEFANLSPVLDKLKTQDLEDNGVLRTKVVALSSYLGTISTYFAVFLHELHNNEDFVSMRDHPIMERILECKEIWRQADELEDYEPSEAQEQSDLDQVSDVEELDEELLEQQDELDDQNRSSESELSESEEEEEEEEENFDIELTDRPIQKKSSTIVPDDIDDFVEDEIADVDVQEKKTRKKTLRFYTSKIDQKENKKTDRFKGDDDIPYKERLYERQQRLLEEARKRGLHDKNAVHLNSEDYNSDDEKVAKDVKQDAENEYYLNVKAGKLQKKEIRHKLHKEVTKAAKEGRLAELAENIPEDGKRAINYQILKNKGLTPKRKKDNRNSRVKKRKKYEKAQKKLKSVRAVYSGGQSGAYEGEKTGIKKNLAKSVRFHD